MHAFRELRRSSVCCSRVHIRSLKMRFARQEPLDRTRARPRCAQAATPGCSPSSVSNRHMQESYAQWTASPRISQGVAANAEFAIAKIVRVASTFIQDSTLESRQAAKRLRRADCQGPPRPAPQGSLKMLRTRRRNHPAVLTAFVHGYRGHWKAGICERPHGNADVVRKPERLVVDGCAAARTEMEACPWALVPCLHVLGRQASGRDVCAGESRLFAERAARAALACEAMTDGDADRLADNVGGELTATAGSDPVHRVCPLP